MSPLLAAQATTEPRVRLSALPLYLLLFTDVVNGLAALIAPGAFNTAALLIKAIIALAMAFYCRWTLAAVSRLLILAGIVGYTLIVFGDSVDAVTLALKTGSVAVLLLLLQQYSRRLPFAALVTFVNVSMLVIASSLLLGLAGIGHSRYGTTEGPGMEANGFLVAGNEINIALVGIFWWLSTIRQHTSRFSISLLLYWLCLVLMVLSQSKTTIIAAAIAIAYFNRRSKYTLLLLLSLAPFLAYLLYTSATWARWAFFYDAYADQGILSALTAGRFGRIGDISIDFGILLAQGAGVLTATGGYIESDPLDLLFNFGVLGFLLFFYFAKNLYDVCRPALVPWFLVMFASCLAGHVVYSVFAAPILFCSFRASGQLQTMQRKRHFRANDIATTGEHE